MSGKRPDFLADLFADLRDRGLLPIIGLLLVCLIAVPFLLGGGGDETTAPPTATAATGEPLPGIETRPVVIASPSELRNYSKRLAAFDSRNPFHQDLPKPDATGSEVPGGAAAESTSTDTGLTGASTSTGTSSATATPTTPTTIPSTPSATPPSPPTTPTGTGGSDGGSKLISIRIDVKTGPLGHAKKVENVKRLDYLPDPQHPVVEYVGGTYDLTKAAFVVSSEVESTEGDGKCAPSPDNCQFLMLEPGQEQRFVYRDETFRLKLLAVKRHEQPLEQSASDSDSGAGAGRQSSSERGTVRNSLSVIDGG